MNKKIVRFIIVTILTVITGCASNPSMSSLTPQEREIVSNIVFLESGQIPEDRYKVLGSVEGFASKRKLSASVAPTVEDEARVGIKIRAAKLGANAIMNMHCEEKHEVD